MAQTRKYLTLKEHITEDGALYLPSDTPRNIEYPLNRFNEMLLKNGFIEEIKDEPWKPKEGEHYEYLTDAGKPATTYWGNAGVDKRRYALGNCFKRQTGRQVSDATLHASEWLKAFKVLRDDMKGYKPAFFQDQMFDVYYDHEDKELLVGMAYIDQHGLIYFPTEADAEESIKKHPKEWFTFLNIEEEK